METRRENLKILAAISATCAFPFSADELFGQQQIQPAAKFLTEGEMKLVSRISDLILPGSSGAGVPLYIDSVIAGNGALQREFREILPTFDTFLSKTEPEQVAILTPLCEEADAGEPKSGTPAALFRSIKNLTCDGYYTSKQGLVEELGYAGNMAMGGFPGCTHGDDVHEH